MLVTLRPPFLDRRLDRVGEREGKTSARPRGGACASQAALCGAREMDPQFVRVSKALKLSDKQTTKEATKRHHSESDSTSLGNGLDSRLAYLFSGSALR